MTSVRLVLAALCAGLVTAGCAAPPKDDGSRWDPVPTGAAASTKEAGPQATASSGPRAPRTRAAANRRRRGDGSSIEVTEGRLPPGFPEGIPIVDGTIVQGIRVTGRLFSVTVGFAGSAASAEESVRRLLLEAGFVEGSSMVTPYGQRLVTFTGAGLQVSATISGGDSSATVIYGVEGGGDGGVR